MTDWQMLVEKCGRPHQLPEVHRRRRRSAAGSEALHDDVEVPAGVARPVHVRGSRSAVERGRAGTSTSTSATCRSTTARPPSPAARWRFSTTCRSRRTMRASFVIDEGRIHLDRIEFDTDGARTVATGVVDVRALAGADLPVQVAGAVPADAPAVLQGREMGAGRRGRFHRHVPSVQGRRAIWPERSPARRSASTSTGSRELYGSLHWTPTAFDVTDAGAQVLRRRRPVRLLDSAARRQDASRPPGSTANFAGVDLAAFTDFQQLAGLRVRGHGQRRRTLLEWPLGPVRRPSGRRASGRDAAGRRAADDRVARRRAAPATPIHAARVGAVRTGSPAAAPADRRRADLSLRSRAGRLRGEPVRDRAHRTSPSRGRPRGATLAACRFT